MKKNASSGGGAVYGIGLFGVLFYYLQSANTAADILLGIIKSIVWPAILTYRLFGFLNL